MATQRLDNPLDSCLPGHIGPSARHIGSCLRQSAAALRSLTGAICVACVLGLGLGEAVAQDDRPSRDRDREGGVIAPDEPRQRGDAPEARSRSEEGQPRIQIAPNVRPRPGRDFTLGVEVRPDRVGYVITRVLPYTPAWRAGLEPGDRLVTVDGYQVGNVGNRIYGLHRELQLRARDDGRVILLVQNVRNQELVTVPIHFDDARGPRVPWGPRILQQEEDDQRQQRAPEDAQEESDAGEVL